MRNEDREKVNRSKGTVTFLDVLGWKGIWKTKKDAIPTLLDLIKEIKETSKLITEKSIENQSGNDRGATIETKVLSISDTIAIFTTGPAHMTIPIHSQICSIAIPSSIKKGIPLRGAISYGDFSIEENIMVGPAVDEAASWHESTNWIGVILTPSCKFNIDDPANIEFVVCYQKIPFKNKIDNLNLCVKWNFSDRSNINNLFDSMGPHTPDIASKYLNTLEFLDMNNEMDTSK